MTIHECAANGDLAGLRTALAKRGALESLDAQGRTPLMAAVASPRAEVEVLHLLIGRGANVNARAKPDGEDLGASVLGVAARCASLAKIKVLVEAGADVRFVDPNGYSILVSAVHRQADESDDEHLAVLDFLIASGAPLDAASKYGESVVSVFQARGAFAKLKFVLDRGANPEPLRWTPLYFAVAFGTLSEVETLLDQEDAQEASLAQRDRWERTPFLLSVVSGRLDMASLLLERGSDRSATSRCGQTALMEAIANDDASMLNWLISQGWDVEASDDFGQTPLYLAVQNRAVACVKGLLAAGASAARRNQFDRTVMMEAEAPEIVALLVAAGEDLSDVGPETRSRLIGIEPSEEIHVSEQDYRRFRTREFGRSNPDRMNNGFWDAMVRSRATGYAAASKFADSSIGTNPVWCFQRFGHSLTQLPDGRYVEVGGEHEDFYDPDFCIYNDVVIHHGDGTFAILGYPEALFPPTDFHSATFRAPYLYIIGSLGYPQDRRPGETPVYRLHCETWAIERVLTHGDNPGWIHGHRARLIADDLLEICGGKIVEDLGGDLVENEDRFFLDLASLRWRKGPSV